jgi:hypothetical protein
MTGTLDPAREMVLRMAGSAEVVISTAFWTKMGLSTTPKASSRRVLVKTQSIVIKDRRLAICVVLGDGILAELRVGVRVGKMRWR